MHVSYTKCLGRYNWASTDKDWCVALYTPFGNVSQTWPEDDEPGSDDLLPSEVLDLIEARLDSYWIHTGREKDKAKIASIREHAAEIDRAWLEAKLARLESQAASVRSLLADLADEVAA